MTVVEETALVHRDPTDVARIIAEAAADPRVDVAKMERLLDMQMRVLARASEESFNRALARLKARLPRIAKNGAIVLKDGKTRIPYAKYEDIHEAITPLMHEEGFTVSYSAELVGNGSLIEVRATFRHADGHQDIGKAYLPLTDDSGAKNRVQGAGSILSYGKRYALCHAGRREADRGEGTGRDTRPDCRLRSGRGAVSCVHGRPFRGRNSHP
jgi:hypothetical protein